MAQFNLGIMYAKGQGVPEDPVRAYRWLNTWPPLVDSRHKINHDPPADRRGAADGQGVVWSYPGLVDI